MKKMKVLLVGILTLIMSFMCFSGCAIFKAGKYQATSITSSSGTVSASLEDNESYVELKTDNTVEVSIKVKILIFDIDWAGEGTWKEQEDGSILITVEGVDHTATLDGNTLTLDYAIAKIVFEK